MYVKPVFLVLFQEYAIVSELLYFISAEGGAGRGLLRTIYENDSILENQLRMAKKPSK